MTTTPHRPVPTALRRTQLAVVAVAAIHVALLALILTHQELIRAGQAALHPGGDLDSLTTAAIIQLGLGHLLFAALMPLRARRLPRARSKDRIVLTGVLAIQLVLVTTVHTLMAALPGYGAWIVALQAGAFALNLGALIALWSPAGRAFFRPAAAAQPVREPALSL